MPNQAFGSQQEADLRVGFFVGVILDDSRFAMGIVMTVASDGLPTVVMGMADPSQANDHARHPADHLSDGRPAGSDAMKANTSSKIQMQRKRHGGNACIKHSGSTEAGRQKFIDDTSLWHAEVIHYQFDAGADRCDDLFEPVARDSQRLHPVAGFKVGGEGDVVPLPARRRAVPLTCVHGTPANVQTWSKPDPDGSETQQELDDLRDALLLFAQSDKMCKLHILESLIHNG